MKSLPAVFLVAFVTVGSSIIDPQYAARCSLNGKGDFVVGCGHDSAFCVQHLGGNVRNIAGAVGDARSIDHQRQFRRAVRRLHLDRPNDLAAVYSVGRKRPAV